MTRSSKPYLACSLLLLAGCPGDDGGTPLFTASMTSDLSTTGDSPGDEDPPDDEAPPDDDGNDTTTTTTGSDETTTGIAAACVDQNIGMMTGGKVAMGDTLDAGDDFASCGGGFATTTGSWDTDFTGSGTFGSGTFDSGGFVTGGDGGFVTGNDTGFDTTGGGGSGDDYVIQWTAPSAGQWAISLEGSDFDTILGVYPPMCGAESTACNDDCFGLQSGVTVDLGEGDTVFIVVDGYSGATGSFSLSIEEGEVECADVGSASATAATSAGSGTATATG